MRYFGRPEEDRRTDRSSRRWKRKGESQLNRGKGGGKNKGGKRKEGPGKVFRVEEKKVSDNFGKKKKCPTTCV